LPGNDAYVQDPCDLLYEPTRQDNSFHVVVMSTTDANTLLDGFTVTGGNANGEELGQGSGGGIQTRALFWGRDNVPVISNCTFIRNSGLYGGAVYNQGGLSLILTDCTFTENGAQWGGGIGNGGTVTLANCTFSNNYASWKAGGLANGEARGTLESCAFVGNQAEYGGAMYNGEGRATLTNCTVIGNSGVTGGAFYNSEGDVTMINCTVRRNRAGRGGVVYVGTDTNCAFQRRQATTILPLDNLSSCIYYSLDFYRATLILGISNGKEKVMSEREFNRISRRSAMGALLGAAGAATLGAEAVSAERRRGQLKGKRVLVAIGEFSEGLETYYMVYRLMEEGASPVVAAAKAKRVQMVVHDFDPKYTNYTERLGYQIEAQVAYKDVRPGGYDGLLIPGGRGPEEIRQYEDVLRIVGHFMDKKLPLGAMCHGPQVLYAARPLKGRRIAAYHGIRADVELAGGAFVDEPVVVDGSLVTSRGWPDLPYFMSKFLRVLAGR